ncbi:methionyl-tRNA formyltransferase [Buchnera aphidicola]|uniref:methionyl-tRNA formyltransferase n=1 Tax=Buchnera aphidicola TaxID=9 RepID=UPI00094C6DC6|nr:methionyl-tRNA formyltransferase [Buchnera aphidicola]
MSKKISKIVFAGSNDFALAHLESLLNSKYIISAVLTKPDNLYCKKRENCFSLIKKYAIKNYITLLQPKNLFNEIFYSSLKQINADILIVSSYGNKIPKKILKIFPFGGINIHASLLPRWKGAAPIQWAILSGDKKTGVSVIKMNSRIDSGKIIYTLSCPISQLDNTITLSAKLIPISLQCMYQSLQIIDNPYIINYQKQNKILEKQAPKIKKKDSIISWSHSVIQIDRLIRAFVSWPCCQFLINKLYVKIKKASIFSVKKHDFQCGEIIEVNKTGIQINTGKGILRIEKIKIPGKKTLHISQILHAKKKIFVKKAILK